MSVSIALPARTAWSSRVVTPPAAALSVLAS
jgi:hypothetical protein